MKKKVTKRNVQDGIAAARLSGKRVYLYDTDLQGFGAMCTPTGHGSFIVEYSQFGRQRRKKIGTVGPMSAYQAREEAKKLLGLVATGRDIHDREKARTSLQDILDLYRAYEGKEPQFHDE